MNEVRGFAVIIEWANCNVNGMSKLQGPVTLQIDSRKFEYVPVADGKPLKKAKSGTSTPAVQGETSQPTA